jgi:hypothetical protein
MSYYDNVEFQIPIPSVFNTGENPQSPIMGYFIGTEIGPNPSNAPVSSIPSALLTTPSNSTFNTRLPYAFSHIKGIVYKKSENFSVHPFEIRSFIDHPFSPAAGGTLALEVSSPQAFTNFTNVPSNVSSTYPENDFLINQVKIDNLTKSLIINGYGNGAIGIEGTLSIKGTYLFI